MAAHASRPDDRQARSARSWARPRSSEQATRALHDVVQFVALRRRRKGSAPVKTRGLRGFQDAGGGTRTPDYADYDGDRGEDLAFPSGLEVLLGPPSYARSPEFGARLGAPKRRKRKRRRKR